MNKRHDEDIDELFERFYAAHFPRVKNFAMMLTKSPHDAEDIAQSIFMKLWMRPDLWTDDASMDAYLHVVTRNEIFALFKHRRVEQDYEDKARASGLMEELCDDPAASPLNRKEESLWQSMESVLIIIRRRWRSTGSPNADARYLR